MRLIEPRHPFFRPLWRRIAVVVVSLGWALFELSTGAVFWAILFGAIGAYAAWEYFVVFDPANYEDKTKGEE